MIPLVVDLSRWDGNVSIPKLKEAGVGAVIAKCGGGDVGLYEDSKWEANYANCKAAGMPVGAYFYSAATTVNQAVREAEYVLKLIKGKQLEYPVYIDVEERTQQALSESTLRAVIQAWLDTIGGGWMRGVYTWKWLLPTGLDCETWICAWTKAKPCECGMWQFGGEVNLLRPTTLAGYPNMDQSYAYRDYPAIIKAAGLNGFEKRKEAEVALGIGERTAQAAEHLARHNAHGYSQNNRVGDGTTETITFSDGSTYRIHGGDYDCSELDRVCVNAGLNREAIRYMWSGNADEELRAVGFARMAFSASKVRRGDVLWMPGHMGIALGNGMQADAHGDEYGGITGPHKGDQTGHEIEVRSLRSSWTYIYRHKDSGSASDDEEWFDMQKTVTFSKPTHVRTKPRVGSAYIVRSGGKAVRYGAGETVTIDGVTIGGGYVWGTYLGSSGKRRYVVIGTTGRLAK